MEESIFIELVNKVLINTAIISVPILLPSLITGVLISLFQAVTQINEQTLTLVPKLFIMLFSYLITGPWIIRFMINFSVEVLGRIPEMGFSSNDLI